MYVVKIDDVKPIPGRDRVECAVVGGWTIMVRKDQFKPGDLGIYFEIDSKVPEKEPFMFLEGKHFKIKTQKYKTPDGAFFSQGLLMSAEDFGWRIVGNGTVIAKENGDSFELGDFLTTELGVIYADAADNKRKAPSIDKYKKMMQRHPQLAKKAPIRWLMKRTWGKKLLFFFLGRKNDKKRGWPEWVVKTDEERIQNLTHMIPDFCNERWIATEKVDGTSTTFTMKRGKGKKRDFFVCSRNVVFDKPDKKCFYETNVYTEIAEKYHIEDVLNDLLDLNPGCPWVTIQGETYGAGVQKRDYGLNEHRLAVFNLIFGDERGRVSSVEMQTCMARYDVPSVPIIGEVTLPNTCEGILAMAGGSSAIDGGMREGIVFRTIDGKRSFKAVDNEFLAKYHG